VLLLAVIAVGCSGAGRAREEQVVLFLHADGTISKTAPDGETLSPEELRRTLMKAVLQFRARKSKRSASEKATNLSGKKRGRQAEGQVVVMQEVEEPEEIEEFVEEVLEESTFVKESTWVPGGPVTTVVAEPEATHGDLDALLKTCVDCGCERFVLRSSRGGRSHAFALCRAPVAIGLPDPSQLPPLKLHITADENGRIDRFRLNQKGLRDFGALRGYIIGILGDERGPHSIQEQAELTMHCDAELQLQCVFDALEAVTGYDTDDGRRVALIEKVRPVAWGGAGEIEEFEEEEMAEIDIYTEISPQLMPPQPDTESIAEEAINIESTDPDAAAIEAELEAALEATPPDPAISEIRRHWSGPFSCRRADARKKMVAQGGGNAASEAAVAAALKWFAAHQLPDGSWNFDHTRGPCQGRCPNTGNLRESPRAATAMALLPFLAAGQTHVEGKYRPTVKNGLNFLVRSMTVRGGTGSLDESGGNMYSHGLGSIALCEAYAMTRDKALLQPAQLSLHYIAYAQDPVGGGWRYKPKQPGDTSVLGWQLMALKTGHLAYLSVDPKTIKGAIKFLDSVQANSGANYGYTGPTAGRDATTAIGLLCRMYLGWKKDHPALEKGVEYLSKKDYSTTNMYYNYYATQVMRHYGGDVWQKWNRGMRDHLVKSQSTQGHSAGSWHFEGVDHGGAKGGRIYCTSMATLILEIYYRYPPIYREREPDDDFPL
jgi:hypothetical protein